VKKKIIKSYPSTERLMQIRANKLKRDMERGLNASDRKDYAWVVYDEDTDTVRPL
jgi:hypothetical protein